jgi:pyruvate,water dikinase
LHNYGYLSSSGSDFSVAVWAETPTVIWRAINRAAEQSLPAPVQDAAALRAGAVRDVRARMHPAICPAFSRLLGSTMTFIDRRERMSLLMSEYSYQIRRLYLAIADRLVASGGMNQPADIFFLTQDETKALLEGTLDGAEAALRIRTRAVEMEADAAVEPPDVVRGDPARLRPTLYADSPTAAYLSGIGASSGIATGRARVVRDPLEAPPRLGRTDILVVPHSDVGWTPLFPGVGAIVAETGGQLSHTAIVAREYGLPAVVSVKGATRLIRDGQDLVVDGDRGRVYLQPLQA